MRAGPGEREAPPCCSLSIMLLRCPLQGSGSQRVMVVNSYKMSARELCSSNPRGLSVHSGRAASWMAVGDLELGGAGGVWHEATNRSVSPSRPPSLQAPFMKSVHQHCAPPSP